MIAGDSGATIAICAHFAESDVWRYAAIRRASGGGRFTAGHRRIGDNGYYSREMPTRAVELESFVNTIARKRPRNFPLDAPYPVCPTRSALAK